MNTEIVKPENKNLAIHQPTALPAGIEMTDLEPSRLMLQQKMSKLVDEGKAKPGDVCDSVSGEVLAGDGKPLEFIPLSVKKFWVTYDVEGKDKKYRGITPFGPTNANWKYEEIENGKPIKNDLIMAWTVLPINSDLPAIIHFKSMSFRAGKKLANLVAKIAFSGKRHTTKVFQLLTTKQSNDKGSFYTFDVSVGRDAKPGEAEAANAWEAMVTPKPVKVDAHDLEGEEVPF